MCPDKCVEVMGAVIVAFGVDIISQVDVWVRSNTKGCIFGKIPFNQFVGLTMVKWDTLCVTGAATCNITIEVKFGKVTVIHFR